MPPHVTGMGWPTGRFTSQRSGVTLQACADGSCATDTGETQSELGDYPFVYAIGSIAVRFPSLGVEKEFVQATGRGDTAGLLDAVRAPLAAAGFVENAPPAAERTDLGLGPGEAVDPHER